MFSKKLFVLVLLAVFVLGCAKPQQTGTSQPYSNTAQANNPANQSPQTQNLATSAELTQAGSDIEGLQGELVELDNSLDDTKGTDDVQVLEVNNDLFK